MKNILTILAFLTSYSFTFSQNILGGDFSLQQISQLTFQYTVTTIEVQDISTNCELSIDFGDNTNSLMSRVEVVYLPNNIKRNKYITTHTYPGAGTYEVSITGCNWIPNIQNITNSGNEPFQIIQLLQINTNGNFNNSVSLTSSCYANAIVNQQYIYNIGAYDPDGDSLSYSLIPCFVSIYNYPTASNLIGIDSITGDFTWDKPTVAGTYAIGIVVKEWRNGTHINSTIRQMTIKVNPQTSVETMIENDKLIRVYPNIVNEYVYIKSDLLLNENLKIEIINSNGQKMQNIDLENNLTQINITNFSKGIYFIKIINSKFSVVKKIIKI